MLRLILSETLTTMLSCLRISPFIYIAANVPLVFGWTSEEPFFSFVELRLLLKSFQSPKGVFHRHTSGSHSLNIPTSAYTKLVAVRIEG